MLQLTLTFEDWWLTFVFVGSRERSVKKHTIGLGNGFLEALTKERLRHPVCTHHA